MKGIGPRERFPDIPMTEEEAQAIMHVENSNGFMLDTARGCALALMILRADDAELEEITQCMEKRWGIKFDDT